MTVSGRSLTSSRGGRPPSWRPRRGLGLFALGAATTIVTGRSALRSSVRQLLIGWAAAVTYGMGALIGISVGG